MSKHLQRAISLLQFADNDLAIQLATIGDELKLARVAAVQRKVREVIEDLRSRPPS